MGGQDEIPQAVVLQPVAVTVPANTTYGQVVSVVTPAGDTTQVPMPYGVVAGQVIQVLMPATPLEKPLQGIEAVGSILANADRIEVNQRVLLGEALTAGCCEQQNIFDIKIDGRDGPRVLLAKEQSYCCDRCCCNPRHSLLVHVSPAFQSEEVYMTLERKGMECFKCCWSPRPCLNCFSCSECCTEEVIIHDGGVFGKVGELENPNPVAVLRQPMQCCKPGGCTPTVHVYPATSADVDPVATITGPTCFGGCSELCFQSNFRYSSTTDGDVRIQHLIPRSIGEVCKAICTDSDNYVLEFPPSASPETRAQALASAFLLDYMFFEIDNGMCRYDPAQEVCIITCCLCFCYGCLCPCELRISTKKGGRPPAPEDATGSPPNPENQSD